MYSAIARNKRNTVFIILVFLVIIGSLAAAVAWYVNDWTIAIVTLLFAGGYAVFQYFMATQETLSLAGARQVGPQD